MSASIAMVHADRAVELPACSAATRVHSHTTKKIRASRQLQRASMESRAMSANLGSQRCSVESCQWLRPTRRQDFRGRLRADGSRSGSTSNSARLNSATSQLKDIRRLNKAAPTIKRFASRGRPENDRVGAPSATPSERFVQQSLAESLAPHFRNDIKVRYISMKLRFVVYRIGDFLKKLHANVPE